MSGIPKAQWYTEETTEKRCGRCNVVKPLTEFHMIKNQAKSGPPRRPHGYCKACNKTAMRLWNHGITQAQYDAMNEAQNGLCAICQKPPEATTERNSMLHIDHDHATGKVRALLCSRCNNGLGCYGDDIEVMMAAVAYLIEHSEG